MSVKYPNYVNLTSSSEEHLNERTPSPPPRKKSLSPPQAPSKSISSKSTHYTSSSSPNESSTPTHVAPPPKLRPYTPTMVTTPAVPATENSPEIPEKTSVETVLNMTPENKAHYESEKEAIHLILTGIGDEMLHNVMQCHTAQRCGSHREVTNKLLRNSEPDTSSEGKDIRKKLGLLIAKVLQKLYKPSNNNPKLPPNTQGTRMWITTPRWSSSAPVWNTLLLTCKEICLLLRKCRKPNGLRLTYHKEKMLSVIN
ncbi:hypothetical protein Tco_0732574 [Tanacetum coccineum]